MQPPSFIKSAFSTAPQLTGLNKTEAKTKLENQTTARRNAKGPSREAHSIDAVSWRIVSPTPKPASTAPALKTHLGGPAASSSKQTFSPQTARSAEQQVNRAKENTQKAINTLVYRPSAQNNKEDNGFIQSLKVTANAGTQVAAGALTFAKDLGVNALPPSPRAHATNWGDEVKATVNAANSFVRHPETVATEAMSAGKNVLAHFTSRVAEQQINNGPIAAATYAALSTATAALTLQSVSSSLRSGRILLPVPGERVDLSQSASTIVQMKRLQDGRYVPDLTGPHSIVSLAAGKKPLDLPNVINAINFTAAARSDALATPPKPLFPPLTRSALHAAVGVQNPPPGPTGNDASTPAPASSERKNHLSNPPPTEHQGGSGSGPPRDRPPTAAGTPDDSQSPDRSEIEAWDRSGRTLNNLNLRRKYLHGLTLPNTGIRDHYDLPVLRQMRSGTFAAANLSGAKIEGTDFTGSDLKNANFTLAKLADNNFNEVEATRAKFALANLTNSKLSGNFDRADFSGAELGGIRVMSPQTRVAQKSVVSMKEANFQLANLPYARLLGIDLEGASFKNARLPGTNFDGSSLKRADLTGTFLDAPYFGRADLDGANFSFARLVPMNDPNTVPFEISPSGVLSRIARVSARGAPMRKDFGKPDYQPPKLPNLEGIDASFHNLSNLNLTKANAPNIDLSLSLLNRPKMYKADLSGSVIRTARIKGGNLVKAELSRANFQHTELIGTNLGGAQMRGANFELATLQGVQANNAYLRKANFANANLLQVNLTNADLIEARLTDAKFVGTNFYKAKLRGADFQGATIQPDRYGRLMGIRRGGGIRTEYELDLSAALNVPPSILAQIHQNYRRIQLSEEQIRQAQSLGQQ